MMLYSFDDYTLNAEHYELRQAGRLVPIQPRVLDVVAYLVQHAGRTVTTEELLAQLYPNEFAPHNRLTNAVAQARKVLGDTGQTQRYIQTVHRRGYRFMAPVTVRPPGSADLPAAPTPDPSRPQATPPTDQANVVPKPAHTPPVPASDIGRDWAHHAGEYADPGGTKMGLPLALGGCPGCGFENPAGVRFCIACGRPLGNRCPSCGAETGRVAKFCGACGVPLTGRSLSLPRQPLTPHLQTPLSYTPVHLAEKILTSKGALEGERKQVTVLFANLKGAAEWLVDCDPEEAQRLLDPLLDRMLEAIHRYEGTVNHLLGDGIMALFGALLAHEDHAARACYAALAMQKAIHQHTEELRRTNELAIELWVGLNSGDVVVRAIGNDLHMEYSAVGQTTFLAACMEQLAQSGGIWLTTETLRLVEGFVQVKPLDPVRIEGVRSPVEVFELVGAEPTRTRLQAAAARVLTPFVGRQHEFETIRQALERAGSGHGQVVAVIGEPGVGKSRLFYEFTHAPHIQGWVTLEAGAVSSYGKATPYLPIIDLLRTYFQVEGPDDGRGMREKVTDKLLALDEALRPTLPAFFTLLDIPVEDPQWQRLDPPQRRHRMLDAVKRLLLRESQLQPLLLIVENLHWIDTETQAVLDSLIESLPTARILLLLNYRPDYQHSWGNKTYYTQLRLDPLPPARAEELLQALLGRDASLQPLTQRLIERTDGNPFCLEESVWTLAETKALVGERGAYRLAQALPRIQVPTTVQAMLAARIDRLPPEDKRLLQAAAVIGRDIPFSLLQAIAEEPEETLRRSLAHLQAAEFLYELNLFPEQVYTFKHALTQEVAYESLLQRTRQQYHQQIAQVLAERFPETIATQPELLAHHYTEAGLSAQAIPYWQQAGQRAIERSAHVEAISHLTRGLEVLTTLPDMPERAQQELTLQLALGLPLLMIKGHTVPEVEYVYSRALELCQQVGESPQLFSALVGLWRFYLNRGRLQTARELAEQCFTLAQRLQGSVLLQEAYLMLGSIHYYLGELVAARTHLEQGIALYDPQRGRSRIPSSGTDPGVVCLSRAARVLWMLGYPDQALAKSREALTLARQLTHDYSLGFALFHAAAIHCCRGEIQEVQELATAAISLSSKQGFVHWLGTGMSMRGWALAEQGRAEEGISELLQGLATMQSYESELGLMYHRTMLAEAYGKGGRAKEGLLMLTQALAGVHQDTVCHYEAELHRLKGELSLQQALQRGDPRTVSTGTSRVAGAERGATRHAPPLRTEVEICFRHALNTAQRQSAKSLELRAAMSLSRLWQQEGRYAEARQMMAGIYDWFTEGFESRDLKEAKALLEALA